MVGVKDLGSMEIKDMKNAIKVAKEKRMEKIVELGELVHLQILNEGIMPQQLSEISAEIVEHDRVIYHCGRQLIIASVTAQQCSKCLQQIVSNAKFCGNCGMLNPNHVDEKVVLKTCRYCTEEIDETMQYCPCCGVKQEEI